MSKKFRSSCNLLGYHYREDYSQYVSETDQEAYCSMQEMIDKILRGEKVPVGKINGYQHDLKKETVDQAFDNRDLSRRDGFDQIDAKNAVQEGERIIKHHRKKKVPVEKVLDKDKEDKSAEGAPPPLKGQKVLV